jgi:hypothetical protein
MLQVDIREPILTTLSSFLYPGYGDEVGRIEWANVGNWRVLIDRRYFSIRIHYKWSLCFFLISDKIKDAFKFIR